MRLVDWIVFVAFLAWCVWDGVKRRGGAQNLEGYFAGGRKIPWWAAGLSIMATQASAITIIGTTGQGHEQGLDFVQSYFGLPFAMILLCIFLVPLYRSRAILTPYEYLEERFGPATRSLASLVFLGSRCLALGVVIYAPSVALSAMLGLTTWESVLIIGGLTTLYTMLGGVSAVIWTDVKQMSVIILGLLLILGFLLADLLPVFSLGQLFDLAGAAGKMNALEIAPESTEMLPRTLWDEAAPKSFWEEKYNLWAGLFGGLFLHLSYFGCDFSQAQRLLTSKDVRASRLSLLMSAFAKVPMQVLVLLLGVLMWLFYAVHGQPMLYNPAQLERAREPAVAAQLSEIQGRFDGATAVRRELMTRLAALPDGPRSDLQLLQQYQQSVIAVREIRQEARATAAREPKDRDDTNNIFIRFIFDNLPPLVLGLIIAAIFAAAMSSIDSTLNALSGATVVDFYRRWLRPRASEEESVRLGRWLTLFWGVVATGMALFLEGGGSVIEQINKYGSFFYGSLLGIFALALFVRPAGGIAGFVGLLGGMASVLVVHFTLRIEFLWYNVIGCFGVLVVGGLVAVFERRAAPA
ncbi:MAG: sodium:solute symporter [Planctomycetes bacterium]|nr:sodium:solute symporter [Planctomycetota bacterium]